MCYCPTPTLHLNIALTGDGAFLLPPQKTHSVWLISILNYGHTENVLINHLLLVIPMSYPCHYTNLCPHKPHKHAQTHTHTHTQSISLSLSLSLLQFFSSLSNRPLSRLPLCWNHGNQPRRSARALLCLLSDCKQTASTVWSTRGRDWLQSYFALIYCCRCLTGSGVHLRFGIR